MDNTFRYEPSTTVALVILDQALAGRGFRTLVEPLGRDSAVRGARSRHPDGRTILVYFDDLAGEWCVGTLAPDGMPGTETDAAKLDLRSLHHATDWFTAEAVDAPVTRAVALSGGA